jgi:C-terminal processing protease CtpA/Prc
MGNSSLSNTDNTANDSVKRHEFEAPRKGQLGLVIEANKKTGPIVHAVKDYSPLFGLVKRGDQIVEVDGRKTSQSTLSEITKLLAVRPGRRSTNLRIVVARSKKQNPSQCLPFESHTRDNSYGSSSLASSKILEDVDAVFGEGEPPSDDLLRASYYSDHSTEHGEL